MQHKYFVALLLMALTVIGCDKDDNSDCDQHAIISQSRWENAYTDDVTITNMVINGNCLDIGFTASGCDGSTWVVNLITSGAIAKSLPPQRTLILTLENNEECDAVISKSVSFDIENLQVSGPSVWLILTNSDESLLYEY